MQPHNERGRDDAGGNGGGSSGAGAPGTTHAVHLHSQPPGGGPSEVLGGMHGAGGEYEVVSPTDAGAALGSLAGSLIGSVGAGVVGASLRASAAAVTGAAGMGAALGAAIGHSFGGGGHGGITSLRGGGGDDEYDGGDVPLLGDEDVAIERASRAAEAAEAAQAAAKPWAATAAEEAPQGSEPRGLEMAPPPDAETETESAPELIGLQPLCEMGVNAGMYLGHGHTVAGDAQ
ncbi:hypothetical protein PLESTB_000623900 [Pleodorina starrii]|uniref:Uncharacterized protein n=1 Tax=Pleodorina starrii TaxID=330485 RepID=A0A9W6BHN8_9CHLO|nr:hypothetical protein PLESTB_000623900 [Pleodorina starrii]